MARRYQEIKGLAEFTAKTIVSSEEEREEQNYNMIDNVLNNLPQDPEEKCALGIKKY